MYNNILNTLCLIHSFIHSFDCRCLQEVPKNRANCSELLQTRFVQVMTTTSTAANHNDMSNKISSRVVLRQPDDSNLTGASPMLEHIVTSISYKSDMSAAPTPRIRSASLVSVETQWMGGQRQKPPTGAASEVFSPRINQRRGSKIFPTITEIDEREQTLTGGGVIVSFQNIEVSPSIVSRSNSSSPRYLSVKPNIFIERVDKSSRKIQERHNAGKDLLPETRNSISSKSFDGVSGKSIQLTFKSPRSMHLKLEPVSSSSSPKGQYQGQNFNINSDMVIASGKRSIASTPATAYVPERSKTTKSLSNRLKSLMKF